VPRRLILVVAVAACSSPPPPTQLQRYLDDAEFRRAELEASLVNPDNGYSRLRLERYGRAWEELPVWNPNVAIPEAASAGDEGALIAVGREAYARYPAQLVGGETWTCAECHDHPTLDVGARIAAQTRSPDPGWGPGLAAVASEDEPVRIPDLHAVKYEQDLQVNATVRQRSVVSLALRIETLIITAHGGVIRPPREIALGLALYLWSLAPEGVPADNARFDAECAGCHRPPTFSGPPVDVAMLGFDDVVARSPSRGTGTWRVPSLRGVSSRPLLFHDGSARSLDDVLDPARGGGHRFGLALDPAARADLIAYLRTL
jgi:mono/diheme cytochrome c family protein